MERKGNIRHRIHCLDDLRAWHTLTAICAMCSHEQQIDPGLLHRRFAYLTELIDIELKLRCSACGNREGNQLMVSLAPRNI